MQLRIPGPTPCPPEVLEAMGKQMINHRGNQFADMLNRITARLKELFQTKNDLYVLTGSGTGSMEAAVVNMLSPGDKVLSASNGVFGNRFADIAEGYGAEVTRLKFEWGKPIDPDGVRQALKADPKIKAVLLTHNETSTGVTSDLQAIAAAINEFDKLILVDAISSLGCIDLKTDDWKCDVVVTGSQKGWMVPPGLAMVSISERGWKAHAQARIPRYYWDFTKAKSYLEKGQTPWTPCISVFFALDLSLDMMLKEGLSGIFARHAKLGDMTRKGVKSLGLSLYPADEKYASNTVTAVKGSEKVSASKLQQILRDEYKVAVSGGQGDLTGKIFRIGHLGWVSEADIKETLGAIGKALPQASA
ncbi:MAG: class V aminotransferase [Chloroflexi bacterium RBG_13_50_10]|nr:MAG: class V aminotransferase [Chloroflexi bacterium RBG_13_50_10]